MAALTLLGLVAPGAGCGAKGPVRAARPPSTTKPPEPAAPPEPAGVPIVAFASGASVCTARVLDEGLEPRGCVAVGGAPRELAILGGGEEIYALLASGGVSRLRAGRVEPLALPPPERLETPAPDPGDDVVQAADEGETHLVVAGEGELWLSRCVWTAKYDQPTCMKSVYARLVPARGPADATPTVTEPPAGAAEPEAEPPPEFALRVLEGAEPKVACEGRGEHSIFAAPLVDGAATFVDVRWLSASSPYYLARVVHDYLEARSGEVLLMKACSPEPVEKVGPAGDDGEPIVFGPAGLWAHPGPEPGEGWVLRRGGDVVARLPAGAGRPALALVGGPARGATQSRPVGAPASAPAPSPPVTRR